MFVVMSNLLRHRNLLAHFTYREITSRYKGSYLGVIWSLIQPLFMLVIYSYVFTVIFKTKWHASHTVSRLDYTMAIFAGLIVFQIFSESMYRSSTLLAANVNFVKRVVFPLEVLPTSAVLGVFVLNLFSVAIYIVALIVFHYPLGWHLVLIPVVLLPVVLITLGMSYIVTTLGVFFRDLGQAIGLIMNILFYLTPVFYPVTSVPTRFQPYMQLNPFTPIIDSFRNITIYQSMPEWSGLGIVYVVSVVVLLLGSLLFTKSKESFSDAI